MKLFISCCLLATLVSSCMSVVIPLSSGNYWFMRPTKTEWYENAWERCNEMDGKLAEIYTEDELETAMEALKPYASIEGYGVWTGAVKNTSTEAKEHSYYWNSSKIEVDFNILRLSNKSSPCTASECTLILHSDGKVWPTSATYMIESIALCELHTLNGSKNGYQMLEEQLKNEAKVRNDSINALDVQIKKETQSRNESINALQDIIDNAYVNVNVQIKEETEKVRNQLEAQMKKEVQVREETIKALEAQMQEEAEVRNDSINALDVQIKNESQKVREKTMETLEVQMQKMNVQIKEETEKVRNELKAQMKKEAQDREDSIKALEAQMEKMNVNVQIKEVTEEVRHELEAQMKNETQKIREETMNVLEVQIKKVREDSINALDVQMKKHNESSESNVTSLKKSKSALFVLYSLNLIALLALSVFIFIIWRKVN